MSYFWLGFMVLAFVVEAATVGLVAIWFGLGALAAFLSAVCGGPVWLQITFFILITAVTLIFTRPLAQKYLNSRRRATNADRVLGDSGKVTETIDNENSAGAVYVDGKTWTARSADGSVIPAGTVVEILRMEGVKLFVKKIEEKVEVVS